MNRRITSHGLRLRHPMTNNAAQQKPANAYGLRTEVPSIPFLLLGAWLFAVGLVGEHFSIDLLWLGLLVAALQLTFRIRAPWPLTVHLIDIWILAFLILFIPEALYASAGVEASFGAALTARAGSFIAGAFGATMVGYWMIAGFRKATNRSDSRISPAHILPKTRIKIKQVYNSKSRFFSRGQENQGRAGRRTFGTSHKRVRRSTPGLWKRAVSRSKPACTEVFRAPFFLWFYFTSISLFILYYLFVYMGATRVFSGRAYRYMDMGFGSINKLGTLLIVLLPILIAYLLKRYKIRIGLRLGLVSLGCLLLFVLIAIGTRFYLGFALVGVLYFALDKFHGMPKRRVFMLLAAFVLLLVLQDFLLIARTEGIGKLFESSSVRESILYSAKKEPYLSSEGMLNITTLILKSPAIWEHSRFNENLYLFYWWIPRSLWPQKPTMAGHWLIREYGNARGFGKGYSVSGGFCMPALVDFGPNWGMFFCLVYGALLGIFERFVSRQSKRKWGPPSLFAALLYFGVFFMMRSLQTSLIFMMEAWVVVIIPVFAVEFLSRAKGVRQSL